MKEIYKVGGAIDDRFYTYVERDADADLLKLCRAGGLAFLLTSRQMGKTSMMKHTARRLAAERIRTTRISLTSIGAHNVSALRWYLGLAELIEKQLHLRTRALDFWKSHARLSSIQRLSSYLENCVLGETEGQVVIFIDEMELTLRLKFPLDDFFALIRALHDQRAARPRLERLSFVLIGATTPNDLITDPVNTPFNVGHRVDLTDFTREEVKPLEAGLGKDHVALMDHVLYWTNGHPFLTQRLCSALAAEELPQRSSLSPEQRVQRFVQNHVIDNWVTNDDPPHLTTISQRLLKKREQQDGAKTPFVSPSKRTQIQVNRLLSVYRKVLIEGSVAADETREQRELKLSGLLVKDNSGSLRVRNRIYERVFDSEWVEVELRAIRPFNDLLNKWVESGRNNQSALLRKEQLRTALDWVVDRSLSDDYQEFIRESQNLDFRRREKRDFGLAALALIAAASVIVSFRLYDSQREYERELERARAVENIRAMSRKAQKAVEDAQVGARNKKISADNNCIALNHAIDAAKEFRNSGLNDDAAKLSAYPTLAPLLPLHEATLLMFSGEKHTEPEIQLNEPVWNLTLDPMRGLLGVATWQAKFRLCSVEMGAHGECLWFPAWEREVGERIADVQFGPSKEQLMTGEQGSDLRLWKLRGSDPVTLELVRTVNTDQGNIWTVRFRPPSDTSNAEMNPDVYTAGWDGTVKETYFGQDSPRSSKLPGLDSTSIVRALEFDKNGTMLAAGNENGCLILWKDSSDQSAKADWKKIGDWKAHTGAVWAIAFEPAGDRLVTGGDDGVIRIWSPDQVRRGNDDACSTETTVEDLPVSADIAWQSGQERVTALAFDQDGQRLLSGGWDGSIRVWTWDGKQVGEWDGNSAVTAIRAWVDPANKHQQLFAGRVNGTVERYTVQSFKTMYVQANKRFQDHCSRITQHPQRH